MIAQNDFMFQMLERLTIFVFLAYLGTCSDRLFLLVFNYSNCKYIYYTKIKPLLDSEPNQRNSCDIYSVVNWIWGPKSHHLAS